MVINELTATPRCDALYTSPRRSDLGLDSPLLFSSQLRVRLSNQFVATPTASHHSCTFEVSVSGECDTFNSSILIYFYDHQFETSTQDRASSCHTYSLKRAHPVAQLKGKLEYDWRASPNSFGGIKPSSREQCQAAFDPPRAHTSLIHCFLSYQPFSHIDPDVIFVLCQPEVLCPISVLEPTIKSMLVTRDCESPTAPMTEVRTWRVEYCTLY